MAGTLRILVLGSAAGGGFPQWNCRCPTCQLAWDKDPRVTPRTQSSLAISADGDNWLLLNASPDLRQQILDTPALHPREGSRHSPIKGVLVTNGDIDHLAGLLTLREQQRFSIYGSRTILSQIETGSVFGVLNPKLVPLWPVELDEEMDTGLGLVITPFAVPGKVPLYAEGENLVIGEETETTIGLEISAGKSKFFYIPGCAKVTPKLLARVAGAQLLMFDGTTFTDDEMVRLGLSQKTAWRMGHVPMSGETGSLAMLADSAIARKVYIHINNTNPALIDGSPERKACEAAGWDVAYDGMEIVL
jgi:pyrroloquinoline quinone biosynthesis protein B